MNYEEAYAQLVALQEEYPNIIFKVGKSTKFNYLGYASGCIIEKDFFCITYNAYGFYVNVDAYFDDRYFQTAEDAFDALSVWMHKHGYRFKKYDTPKVINLGGSSVERVPIAK